MTAAQATRHETVMDPTAMSLASVYADALLGAADAAGIDPDTLAHEIDAVAGVLAEGEGAQLLDPELLGRDARVKCVERIFVGKVSEVTAGLLSVMARRGRLSLVRAVAWQFGRLVNRRGNRQTAEVYSAVELDEGQRSKVQAQLRQFLRAEPLIHFQVQAGLLGGLKIRIGDDIYDASIGAGIERLCRTLERGGHGPSQQE
ncbi:MAG: ATP synthase F1 subunit delta [Planctomycetota bacterium]|nr:ATP synthase F1 subunit delta [Planctomycetota bacterium]